MALTSSAFARLNVLFSVRITCSVLLVMAFSSRSWSTVMGRLARFSVSRMRAFSRSCNALAFSLSGRASAWASCSCSLSNRAFFAAVRSSYSVWISSDTLLCFQSSVMALGAPSLPMLAITLLFSRVSWSTALWFRVTRFASLATSAASTISPFCTYLPCWGRSTIWFSWAAFARMLRFSSSAFRASRARCTRFSATFFAMATSSSRCWRAVSMAMAFRWACFCCQASRRRSFSASHSMISLSWIISERSARSARRCSCFTWSAR